MLIVIIDVDQGEELHRYPLVLTNEDDSISIFDAIEEIREIYMTHILNGFQWWAFDMDTGEAEEV